LEGGVAVNNFDEVEVFWGEEIDADVDDDGVDVIGDRVIESDGLELDTLAFGVENCEFERGGLGIGDADVDVDTDVDDDDEEDEDVVVVVDCCELFDFFFLSFFFGVTTFIFVCVYVCLYLIRYWI
jgi:hypothetical protein